MCLLPGRQAEKLPNSFIPYDSILPVLLTCAWHFTTEPRKTENRTKRHDPGIWTAMLHPILDLCSHLLSLEMEQGEWVLSFSADSGLCHRSTLLKLQLFHF